ncbi:MAG: hypothetical protein K9H25_14800 [Rhodospirillum sp.]|nr:hypothetical protein [Rhodospirillum sp.]MCF8490510.1 hypothetical protein [Rhodospirillum sp.]MCF8500633.1 hypothetical protein [Rhodospirillum sp.]
MTAYGDRPTIEGVIAHARDTLDMGTFARLGERFADRSIGSEVDPFDLDASFQDCWTVVRQLDLDRGPRHSILELGAGAGYFTRLATWLGHHTDALDAPENPMGDVLCRWLGVHRITHRFNAGKVLPEFPHFFDLVVAIDIRFNEKRNNELYAVEEWDFLLDDLKLNHLNHRGRIFLRFVDQSDRRGPRFGYGKLMALFKRRGGRINDADRSVYFPHLL